MARITYVKKAQQRYATVPVLDADGKPQRVPVLGRDGKQKTSKRGLVFRTITVDDKTKPLPNHVCGKCGKEIEVGQPYKWIAPKSGPYGGRKLFRCGTCPSWQVWEYSSSLSARLAQVSHEFDQAVGGCSPESDEFDADWDGGLYLDEVRTALEAAAETIREIAEEKREAASNIEDGFGHPTSQSEELEQIADDLDAWADDVAEVDFSEFDRASEFADGECSTCGGEGALDVEEAGTVQVSCTDCDGTGKVFDQEGCSEAVSEWWDEVVTIARDTLDSCPV